MRSFYDLDSLKIRIGSEASADRVAECSRSVGGRFRFLAFCAAPSHPRP